MLRAATSFALMLAAAGAHAALLGRVPATPGGMDYRAYYDTDLDISWLTDADLAATTTFGVPGICENGSCGPGIDGAMTWSTAQAWIAAMNAAHYLGADNWRLPDVAPVNGAAFSLVYAVDGSTDWGYNIGAPGSAYPGFTGNELSHLYFTTLGNEAGVYPDGSTNTTTCSGSPPDCLNNAGPFLNVLRFYWTGTDLASADPPYPNQAFAYFFRVGYQDRDDKTNFYHVWAVRDGDIGTPDTDGDGVPDGLDNCTQVANAYQIDADGDGYGNFCDGDFNNNDATNAQDYAIFRSHLGTMTVPPLYDIADMNGNATVNAQDYAIFRDLLGLAPGPSGLHP